MVKRQKRLDEFIEELIERYVCDGLWEQLNEKEKEIILYEIELTLREIEKARKLQRWGKCENGVKNGRKESMIF